MDLQGPPEISEDCLFSRSVIITNCGDDVEEPVTKGGREGGRRRKKEEG